GDVDPPEVGLVVDVAGRDARADGVLLDAAGVDAVAARVDRIGQADEGQASQRGRAGVAAPGRAEAVPVGAASAGGEVSVGVFESAGVRDRPGGTAADARERA